MLICDFLFKILSSMIILILLEIWLIFELWEVWLIFYNVYGLLYSWLYQIPENISKICVLENNFILFCVLNTKKGFPTYFQGYYQTQENESTFSKFLFILENKSFSNDVLRWNKHTITQLV